MQPRHSTQLRSILSNISPPRIRLEILDKISTIRENCMYHQYDAILPGLRQWYMAKFAPTTWLLGIRSSSFSNQLLTFRKIAEHLNTIPRSITQRLYYDPFRKWKLFVLCRAYQGSGLRRGLGNAGKICLFVLRNRLFSPGP